MVVNLHQYGDPIDIKRGPQPAAPGPALVGGPAARHAGTVGGLRLRASSRRRVRLVLAGLPRSAATCCLYYLAR